MVERITMRDVRGLACDGRVVSAGGAGTMCDGGTVGEVAREPRPPSWTLVGVGVVRRPVLESTS